jgi:hypothetical protein
VRANPYTKGYEFISQYGDDDGTNNRNKLDNNDIEGPPFYQSIMELLKSKKELRLGSECRGFVLVAVADRENKRIQIFRFYWAQSILFRPSVQLAYIIGKDEEKLSRKKEKENRKRNNFIKLIDPMSVCYSSSGELAVCDSGAKKILIFSSRCDFIKSIDQNFVSLSDFEYRQRKNSNSITLLSRTEKHENIRNSLDRILEETKSSAVSNKSNLKSSFVNSPPCFAEFNSFGSLAVGYKNGGR